MNLDFYILTLAILIHTIGAPLYIKARERMLKTSVRVDKPLSFYTKFRIVKLTFFIILLFSLAILGFYILFFSIQARSELLRFQTYNLILLFAFLYIIFLIVFGGGIYITAIIQEQYILLPLKKIGSYKTLSIVNKVFHGPISHVLIYSGAYALLMIICFLERYNPLNFTNSYLLAIYIIYGFAFGIMYFWSRVKDSTWRYQKPVMLFIFFIYLVFLLLSNIDLKYCPFNVFYLVGSIILNFGLAVKSVHFDCFNTLKNKR